MASQPESQSEKPEKRDPPTPRPVIVRIFRALKRYENRRRRRRKTQHQTNERMMARWTRHVGLFTLALVFVGIVTAVIFGKQLTVMQGQLDAFQSEAVIRLRSYVSIAGTRNKLQIGNPVQFTAVIQAGGQSPAFDVSGWGAEDMGSYLLPRNFKFIERIKYSARHQRIKSL
jgi:hypothetical protein